MRIDADETSVVLTNRPIVERVFNAFSVVAGGFTAWVCLRFYDPGGDWEDLTLALFAPFLFVFAVASLWHLLTLPTMVCRIDGARRVVELSRRAPLARHQTGWRFEEVDSLRVEEPLRISLLLRDGRRVAILSDVGDRDGAQRFVSKAQRIITTA